MGIVTSISGGAGVFAIPTMLAFGFPPINVLALNRISDLGTVFGALLGYYKSKKIDWKLAIIISIPLTFGSFIGAITIIRLPEEVLNYVIIIGVIFGILLLLKKRKPKTKHNRNHLSKIGLITMIVVGLWSGSLAMAGATFAVLALVYFFGKTYLEGRSTHIVSAIPETIVSSTILVIGSKTSFILLFTMLVSSFIGSFIGSRLAVKRGNDFIRKAMIAIAILMLAKTALDLILY